MQVTMKVFNIFIFFWILNCFYFIIKKSNLKIKNENNQKKKTDYPKRYTDIANSEYGSVIYWYAAVSLIASNSFYFILRMFWLELVGELRIKETKKKLIYVTATRHMGSVLAIDYNDSNGILISVGIDSKMVAWSVKYDNLGLVVPPHLKDEVKVGAKYNFTCAIHQNGKLY